MTGLTSSISISRSASAVVSTWSRSIGSSGRDSARGVACCAASAAAVRAAAAAAFARDAVDPFGGIPESIPLEFQQTNSVRRKRQKCISSSFHSSFLARIDMIPPLPPPEEFAALTASTAVSPTASTSTQLPQSGTESSDAAVGDVPAPSEGVAQGEDAPRVAPVKNGDWEAVWSAP